MTVLVWFLVWIASLADAPAAIRESKLPDVAKGFLLSQFIREGGTTKQFEFVFGKDRPQGGFGSGAGASVVYFCDYGIIVHATGPCFGDVVGCVKFRPPKISKTPQPKNNK